MMLPYSIQTRHHYHQSLQLPQTLDGSGAPVQNGGSTRSNQVTFQFTTSGGTPPVILQCSLDNSAFSSCSSPVTCTNLGVGQHTSLFRATDSVALQGPSISFKWRVTATPPPPDSVCGSRQRKW